MFEARLWKRLNGGSADGKAEGRVVVRATGVERVYDAWGCKQKMQVSFESLLESDIRQIRLLRHN